MNRIVFTVLIIMAIAIPCFADTGDTVPIARKVAAITADANVQVGPGVLEFIYVMPDGTNSCICKVYDDASTGTTTQIAYAGVDAGSLSAGGTAVPTPFSSGIYIDLTGSAGTCTCIYGLR